jgi:hypothetical protein
MKNSKIHEKRSEVSVTHPSLIFRQWQRERMLSKKSHEN